MRVALGTPALRNWLTSPLGESGHEILFIETTEELLNIDQRMDVIVVDAGILSDMPDLFFEKIRAEQPTGYVIYLRRTNSSSSTDNISRFTTIDAQLDPGFTAVDVLEAIEIGITRRRMSAARQAGQTANSDSEYLLLTAERLTILGSVVEDMRVNNDRGVLDEIRSVADDLKDRAALAKSMSPSETSEKVIPLLLDVYDLIHSKKGAEIIVSGAVAGILGAIGWPAVTVYAITLAAWSGREAFLEALRARVPQSADRGHDN